MSREWSPCYLIRAIPALTAVIRSLKLLRELTVPDHIGHYRYSTQFYAACIVDKGVARDSASYMAHLYCDVQQNTACYQAPAIATVSNLTVASSLPSVRQQLASQASRYPTLESQISCPAYNLCIASLCTMLLTTWPARPGRYSPQSTNQAQRHV